MVRLEPLGSCLLTEAAQTSVRFQITNTNDGQRQTSATAFLSLEKRLSPQNQPWPNRPPRHKRKAHSMDPARASRRHSLPRTMQAAITST
jgi:hypothetical protein